MKYDVVIGLEIHAELNTKTKLFCGCKNDTSAPANTNCCEICLARVGTENKKTNKEAVKKIILAGLAHDCKINKMAVFERKHYEYPDLPGGFQTTQNDYPNCIGGGITLKSGKLIRLNRIHLEEDAGKLLHDDVNEVTLVDLNRAGTPLIEMVTEPDFSSADEAVEFLTEVRSRLMFAGVANCKMEEGGMRCDVNISLKPIGAKEFGNRVEMKNVNSFKMVSRAIEYEIKRQTQMLDEGKTVKIETRKWNEGRGVSTAMRSKEVAADYNYTIDPNLPSIKITEDDINEIRASMPKLANEYREEFETKLGLPKYDADILTRDKKITEFFNECLKILNEPKKLSNWILTNVLAKAQNYNILITPRQLCDIIKLNKKEMIDDVWDKPDAVIQPPEKIGEAELTAVIKKIFADFPDAKNSGKEEEKIINFFMGQTMKATKGLADPEMTKKIILSYLK